MYIRNIIVFDITLIRNRILDHGRDITILLDTDISRRMFYSRSMNLCTKDLWGKSEFAQMIFCIFSSFRENRELTCDNKYV